MRLRCDAKVVGGADWDMAVPFLGARRSGQTAVIPIAGRNVPATVGWSKQIRLLFAESLRRSGRLTASRLGYLEGSSAAPAGLKIALNTTLIGSRSGGHDERHSRRACRGSPGRRAMALRPLVAALNPLDPGLACGQVVVGAGQLAGGSRLVRCVLRCIVGVAALAVLSPRLIQTPQSVLMSLGALARILGEPHGFPFFPSVL